MSLGPFVFHIDAITYQALRRMDNYRWQNQDRLNQRPSQQFTGLGESRIELNGLLYPEYKGTTHAFQALRQIARLGKPQLLINGHGLLLGRWCIESIEENQQHILKQGDPRKVHFRMSLKRYGDDKITKGLQYTKDKLSQYALPNKAG